MMSEYWGFYDTDQNMLGYAEYTRLHRVYSITQSMPVTKNTPDHTRSNNVCSIRQNNANYTKKPLTI